ncbi:MAG: protease modulator HflC [Oscillospiraceae bacterium]|nr:protease modulator HflC [Oscillospiraceae bacterium]
MKKKRNGIIIAVVVLLIIIVASASFYSVRPNQFMCIARFSQIIDTVSTPGLHAKIPFVDQIIEYPKEKLFYDIRPSEVLTSDSKAMTVDSFVVWRIVDAKKFYQTLGTTETAEDRLDNITFNALKVVIGKILQADIISTDEQSRNVLNTLVVSDVQNAVGTYGIEVIDVKIKRFDLPDDNERNVYERMISERDVIAEQYRAEGIEEAAYIRNEVNKDVNIIISNAEAEAEKIIAEGESEYMRILGEAYNTPDKRDFYIFMRGLDALKASMTGAEKTVVLDANSELAKLLISPY